jgi:CheY-like chemotaxis protein
MRGWATLDATIAPVVLVVFAASRHLAVGQTGGLIFQLASMRRRCPRAHPGEEMTFRVLLVDDNTCFLAAARGLLEQEGMTVVGVVSTGDDAMRLAVELRPEVTLVDVDLCDESGFDVARRLMEAAAGEPARVILMSAYPEDDLPDLADAGPVLGFVPKASLSAKAITDLLQETDLGAR